MNVLVPIDGSECSFRALEFGAEFAHRYEADIDVVHITDVRGDDTERLVDRANEVLAAEGLPQETEVVTDVRISQPRYANRIGKDILEMAESHDYDHVVMGHHGQGAIGRAIIGSAAETVVQAAEVPATIVP